MSVHDITHRITLVDGPLAGQEITLKGVCPTAMFQIAGGMQEPIFHLYFIAGGAPRIDENQQAISKDWPVVYYKFAKTYNFFEMAPLVPKDMEL